MCGWRDAKQLEPPKAAPPPSQRSAAFCQLVRIVGRPFRYGSDRISVLLLSTKWVRQTLISATICTACAPKLAVYC